LLKKLLAEPEPVVDITEEEDTDTEVLIGRLRPREASEVREWLDGDGPDVVEVNLDDSVLPVPLRTSKLR